MEIPCTGSEKKRLLPQEKCNRLYNEIYDNLNHHGTQTMITTFLQQTELEESLDKILLPPTDPNAEVQEIPPYKLVYVNGACPKTYRVYTDDSMIGVIFQHITHWSNAVDKIRYAEPVDAAVGLDQFMKVAVQETGGQDKPTCVARSKLKSYRNRTTQFIG
ncbi:hypothetical protein [Nostoc sp. LEGE 12450]|uniref:hypothetical protein n=1 Tax=Nostoc sp. LEGE 12450 TaxID=1828643 RepID=UPI00187E86E6|nr:hypothetical protein [Nostoc sp. LEGE 12450]MBE8991144.1 hypothetical protein [Nostoc sp. LEGE 12450]